MIMKSLRTLFFLAFLFPAGAWCQSPGQRDSSFAEYGILQANLCVWDAVSASLIQPDGKILVTGYSEEEGHSEFYVMRILPNGDPDLDFGVDGLALAKVSEWVNQGTSLALQPDGKILVGGYTNTNGNANMDFAALRFTSEGIPDSTFNQDGIVTLDISSFDRLLAIAVLPDGRIAIAGVTKYPLTGFLLACFLPNGDLDTGFGSNGYTYTLFGSIYDVCSSMVIQPDGKILLTGYTTTPNYWADVALARYNSDGTLDATFGAGGKVTTAYSATADVGTNVTVGADGKILVAGYSNSSQQKNELALFRYMPNGTLDGSFGSGGKLRSKIGNNFSYAHSAITLPDGKILAAGCALNATGLDFAMKKFNDNGTVDNTFGVNGIVTTDLQGFSDGASTVMYTPDGKILLAGTGITSDSSTTDIVLVRYISSLNVGVIETPQSVMEPWIYPNPIATDNFTLEYKVTGPTRVAYELFSIDGKRLAVLGESEKGEGEQSEKLMLPGGLANGQYLLNVRTNRGNVVIKIHINR